MSRYRTSGVRALALLLTIGLCTLSAAAEEAPVTRINPDELEKTLRTIVEDRDKQDAEELSVITLVVGSIKKAAERISTQNFEFTTRGCDDEKAKEASYELAELCNGLYRESATLVRRYLGLLITRAQKLALFYGRRGETNKALTLKAMDLDYAASKTMTPQFHQAGPYGRGLRERYRATAQVVASSARRLDLELQGAWREEEAQLARVRTLHSALVGADKDLPISYLFSETTRMDRDLASYYMNLEKELRQVKLHLSTYLPSVIPEKFKAVEVEIPKALFTKTQQRANKRPQPKPHVPLPYHKRSASYYTPQGAQ